MIQGEATTAIINLWLDRLREKDAEIERLKDLARRLAIGWEQEHRWEFGSCVSSSAFGQPEQSWAAYEMIKDPEVLELF